MQVSVDFYPKYPFVEVEWPRPDIPGVSYRYYLKFETLYQHDSRLFCLSCCKCKSINVGIPAKPLPGESLLQLAPIFCRDCGHEQIPPWETRFDGSFWPSRVESMEELESLQYQVLNSDSVQKQMLKEPERDVTGEVLEWLKTI